jgi:MoaA/NifB/PqqE/SkfB family radical SAM enzyme
VTDTIVLDQYLDRDPGELYSKLNSIYRVCYPADYRLIVEYNRDRFANQDHPGQCLSNFVKFVANIDISSNFIVIRTSYQHIHRDLTALATIHKTTMPVIESSDCVFKVIPTKQGDTFCVLPWIHLYFNPQGQITPCCIADNNYPLGNYLTEKVDFNSASLVELRKNMLDGVPVPHCTSCYKREQANLPSLRQLLNKKFDKFIPASPTPTAEFKLRHLDIRLNNVCNLKCRMCSGQFSNRIAHEDKMIWGTTQYLTTSNQPDDKLLPLVQEQIENVESIYFAGGEPLINNSHYKILQFLIDKNKLSVEIKYNTNFSILRYQSHNIIDYWKKFSNVNVGASLDLIGPAANYVRNGVEYSVLENNYRLLTKHCPTVNFEINSVLSLYNAFNLCDLQQHWIKTMGLSPTKFKVETLFDPDYLTLQVLPAEFKEKIHERISQHIEFLQSYSADDLIKVWTRQLEFMQAADTGYLLKNFFEMNDARDAYRKQRFEDYLPEYKTLRNFIV